jgi:hypothetical protein
MKKIYLLIIVSLFLGFVSPSKTLAADETDLYANSVYSAGDQTYKPENSLGTPDSIYTDFFEKDAAITLDMGENESGIGDLTLYFKTQDFRASYRVEFLDVDLNKLQTSSNAFPTSASELTLSYTGGLPYRYVTITNVEEETWSLDAIMTSEIETVAETEFTDEWMTEEEMQEVLNEFVEGFTDMFSDWFSCGGNHGLLVKRVDDDNVTTDADSIIYEIGCDNVLHIVPNEATYKTWWTNYEDVSFIESSFLISHELGASVTVRPGTCLVKQTSSPKVYAVEPSGILRWIPDEATAETLYGPRWNTIILDIPDAIFADYTVGDDLGNTAYPAGILGYNSDGQVVYLDSDTYYTMPGGILSYMRFQSKFLVDLNDAIMLNYMYGGDLTEDSSISLPF